jgi:hypothetical protein
VAENDFMTGYSIGQNENKGGFGFGGDGIWGFLVLALIFGWGGGGWGFGGGGGGAGLQGMATRADITAGFQTQDIINGIRGLERGLCDGFYGVQSGINSISHQLSDCCCQTQRAIDGVNYNMATQANALQGAICNSTRDIIDSQQAGTRAILDFLTNDKIDQLRSENQTLRFQASQAQQNAFITANQEAQTAELIRRLGADCPTPAYLVQPPTPVNFPVNGCGTVQFGYNGCNAGYTL